MGVVHGGAVAGDQEDVAAVDLGEAADGGQGVVEAGVDVVGAQVDELGGDAGDERLKLQAALEGALGLPAPGQGLAVGDVGAHVQGQEAGDQDDDRPQEDGQGGAGLDPEGQGERVGLHGEPGRQGAGVGEQGEGQVEEEARSGGGVAGLGADEHGGERRQGQEVEAAAAGQGQVAYCAWWPQTRRVSETLRVWRSRLSFPL